MSYRAWRDNYGGDPSVIGAAFIIGGASFTVVGIAPPGFFGADIRPDPPDFWMPLGTEPGANGRNSLLGWDASLPGKGAGAKSLGRELAHSDAFATCQVQKVFRAVCLRNPSDAADRARVQAMAGDFKAGGYRLKQVFAEAASYCKGD